MQVIRAVKYEYLVCQVQYSRVTYINGKWDGNLPPTHEKALDSCRYVWDLINMMGMEGWQMVGAVTTSESNNAQIIYMLREQ